MISCPECGSEDCTTFEYDFGEDRETGYRDAGVRAVCLACGFRADVADFETEETEMDEWNAVQNSSIAEYTYNPETKVLAVRFARRSGMSPSPTYRYKEVPQEVFEEFVKAEHKGAFVATQIRNVYPWEKTDEEKSQGQASASS